MDNKNKKIIIENQLEQELKLAKKNAEFIWDHLDDEIKESQGFIKLNDKDVVTENSLTTIQGKTGAHKSRMAEALSILLITEDENKSIMGFTKSTSETFNVIYVDTERNKSNQLIKMINSIKTNCDLNKDELRKRFSILPLKEVSRLNKIKIIGKIFEEIKSENSKRIVIIIDIVTDLTDDFNSLIDSNKLIDIINIGSGQHNITFILVIHENPGESVKARGHLGTELSNKASNSLQIAKFEKSNNVFKITALKRRDNISGDSILVRYDDDARTLVPLSENEIEYKRIDYDIVKLCDYLCCNSFNTIERTELITNIEKNLNWKSRKIEDKLKFMIDNKTQIEILNEFYMLEKVRGKSTIYKMVLLKNDSEKTNLDNIEGGNIDEITE